MPFDGSLQLETGEEGLRQVVQLLREPLPENFEWNYMTSFEICGRCAVGCAMGLLVWRGYIPRNSIADLQARFGMCPTEFAQTFGGGCQGGYSRRGFRVTPEDVAQAIEKVLARRDLNRRLASIPAFAA